ncbi:tRNA pseudouridine synthase Pus10-like isoform X2 [Antedon mediterranea]|uniref:tRNA pseudouridine synthase Pus10-like isoform X2 n=1 Tax=Antedon mediterranea TaxID=105859 RepID=UPI003AF7917B
MFGTTEEQTKVIKDLQSTSCCQRCILRYLGSRIHSHYKENNTSEVINKMLYKKTSLENATEKLMEESVESDETNTKNENVSEKMDDNEVDGTQTIEDELLCISCLGTLQDKNSSLFVSKVLEAVQEADHKYESFQLSVSLSTQFILRQYAIWKHLQSTYRSLYSSHKLEELCSIKDVLKWVYGPKLSSSLDVKFSSSSPFEIALSINNSATSRECDFLNPGGSRNSEPPSKRRKKSQNYDGVPRTIVNKKLSDMSADELERHYPWPPSTPTTMCTVTIAMNYAPAFVAGRYNKYSRTLSQTPWFINGERKTPHSVEEYICLPIKKHLKAKNYKFSSSGREDVDVKTLGRGRPFLVELLDPHRALQVQQEITKLQELINSETVEISVNDLQMVTKEETKMLKEGEIAKTKSYKAKIWVAEAKTQEDLNILETFKVNYSSLQIQYPSTDYKVTFICLFLYRI